MKTKLDKFWIRNLVKLKPEWTGDGDLWKQQKERMADYVTHQSNDCLFLDKYKWVIIQTRPLPWSFIFDLVKALWSKSKLDNIVFIVFHQWPSGFEPRRPDPGRGMMYASYNRDKDAISLTVYTGDYIEHRGDDDGFGEEKDEHRALTGLCDRQGYWISGPGLEWL